MKAQFGLEWVARWYILLEMVAEKMDESGRCHLEYPVYEWCKKLECRPQKLRSWILSTTYLTGTEVVDNGEIIRISIPKLLEKRDNHTKHLQATSKQLVSKIKSKEIRDKSKDTEEENTPNPLFSKTVETWNSEAPKLGLAKVLTPLSPKRATAVKARSREPNFDLTAILSKIKASDFLRGQNNRNWKADFDFVFCSTTNYHKILEGKYDSPEDNGYV